jgi:hypothetical protein
MDELSMTGQGQFDLFDNEPDSFDEPIPVDWDPADDGDPEAEPDDDQDAWLASLPPDIRAELEARPPVLAAPWESAAAARAAFADGGVCDAMPPSWYLGQALTEATLDGYGELTDDELTGVLRACERQISGGYAALARAVIEVAERRAAQSRRPASSGLADHVTDELAAELTLTGRSARRLLDVAAGLRRLPEVGSELLNGAIDWPRACVFVDELSVLGDAAAREISVRLADRAAGWTTGQLRAALVRVVLAADPDAADRRKSAGRKDTRVETWHEPSGNAVLAGRELPPAEVIAADARLAADADWLRGNGAAGTLAELRAMAYLARLSGRDLTSLLAPGSAEAADCEPRSCGTAGIGGDSGTGDSRSGSVHLTMPLSALADLAQSPGEVAGYGPVDSRDARELARMLRRDKGTRWCLTVTGPGGTAVAHACARCGPAAGQPVIRWAIDLRARLRTLERGTCSHSRASAGYVPPPRLGHLIRVRQRRCSFRGCRRAAVRCDLDHTVPFETGGLTCECNLAPLCRRHHRAKQTPGWQLTQDQPGYMTWRLPSGRRHQTGPEPYPF